MEIDPVQEWQRLTAEYRQKSAEELLELARDYADLTETAQQVLRSEMRSRGLGDPKSAGSAPALQSPPTNILSAPATTHTEPEPGPENPAIYHGLFGRMPELVPDDEQTGADEDGPHEYTWKTLLCDCETNGEAQQLAGVLRQAGIESWIQQAREFGRRDARVLVAADQLDQARAIAANPIPQEIVDESKEDVLEFVEPKCPKCGSDDVVLEGVDPENTWHCEQCDEQWTETPPKAEGEASEAAQNAR
jgi:hypothetical protein